MRYLQDENKNKKIFCAEGYLTVSYTELSIGYPKAKKIYYCEWCNEQILAGEKHLKRVYIFCGDFVSGRMHLECEEAMNESNYDDLMEGWIPGDFSRGKVYQE